MQSSRRSSPADQTSRGRAIVLAAAVLLALLVAWPFPQDDRVVQSLCDLVHAPAFALLACALHTAARPRRPRSFAGYGLAIWLVLSLSGGLIELVQGSIGRHPSWQDAAANALGACAGVLWAVSRSDRYGGWRVPLMLAALMLVAAASWMPLRILFDAWRQAREHPLLASFESPLELTRWSARECRMTRSRAASTHGEWSLRLELQPGAYPGAALEYPPRDWSGFSTLVCDLFLEGEPELPLVVKICDAPHNQQPDDRFHHRLRLARGWQRLKIDLSDVTNAPRGRTLDLRRVALLQFYTVRLAEPRTVYVDRIRLK